MNLPLAAVDYIEPWWMVVIKCLVLAFVGLQLVPLVLLAERKILGRFQNRYGPNRVGIYGVGTPIADIIKLLTKEEFRPRTAVGWLFVLAPILSIVAAFGAIQLLCLGVLGEYVGRIYATLQRRPTYYVAYDSLQDGTDRTGSPAQRT